jgi:hypothetical protein
MLTSDYNKVSEAKGFFELLWERGKEIGKGDSG